MAIEEQINQLLHCVQAHINMLARQQKAIDDDEEIVLKGFEIVPMMEVATKLADLELSTRAKNAIERWFRHFGHTGPICLRQIKSLNPKKFRVKGSGKRTQSEIHAVILKHGLEPEFEGWPEPVLTKHPSRFK
ncbi:hypothetical protein KW783_01135 [Candidatus Parcubacteria bacterium]|nr:hypothetical protein [Candidatus Parcubacteria bacterium]